MSIRPAWGTALRRVSAALVLGGTCLIGLAAISTGAQAQAPRSVTVTPSDQLAEGQWARVSWQGFTGDAPVDIRQCGPEATRIDQCSHFLTNASTTSGAGALTFQVHTGQLTSAQACDAGHPCSVVVLEDSAPEDFSSAAGAPISFAKTADSCPQNVTGMTALGSDAAARAMFRWATTLCDKPYRTPVDFTTGNDVQGRRNAWRDLRDFGVTQDPLTTEDRSLPTVNQRTFTYVPLTVSAVSFAYNLHDAKTGAQIDDLKLTPDLLAMIFTGQIDNWNDPRILALNQGHSFPTSVKPIARADGCGLTLELTRFFEATAKAAYEQGGAAYRGGPVDTYPSTGFVDLRTGGDAVAQGLTRPDDTDYSVYGYIGVLDSSAAAFNGLPMVQVANAAGQYVAPTDPAILAGLSHMRVGADGVTAQPEFDTTDPAAYPLPTLTTAVVPTSGTTKATGTALRTILTYASGDGQKVLPAGYVPMPAALTDIAAQRIATIPQPQDPKPTPSPAPHGPEVTPPGTLPAPTPGSLGALSGGTGPGGSLTGGSMPSPTGGAPLPGPGATTPSETLRASTVSSTTPLVLPQPAPVPAPLLPGVLMLSSGAALGGTLLLRREVAA
ncbi:ABC-type phosphate transport system substrate-binding protein [Phycicoccus badiiscoriae]|uniref:ABC-type phosphate transport system substrate-binding protein n=1 Tax=Pedococcus badiiscoriae TaxID=642776 RepID=A0A852WE42_9MICO|nr:ABC-type phosphate transport system substrate-binding protein [Pedococcus badiiscoriae]